MNTVFGMAPILWLTIFIIVYAVYLFSSTTTTNKNKTNGKKGKSPKAWIIIFFLWIILIFAILFVIYFFENFHGM